MTPLPTTVVPVIAMVRHDLAERLSVDEARIELVSMEETIWPDTCLGIPAPELCARTVTPGYRIIFKMDDKQYHYHTDRHGMFRIMESAVPGK